MTDDRRAVLSLETGEHFFGYGQGAPTEAQGEVVFNTSMTGYQEICSDPSYRGEIVVLAYPLINNYGANDRDPESRRPWLSGLIVRQLAENPSNWRNQLPLDQYLAEFDIPVLTGIDTRRLIRILRSGGVRRGVISRVAGSLAPSDSFSWINGRVDLPAGYLDELSERARTVPRLSAQNLIAEVAHPEQFEFHHDQWAPWPALPARPSRPHIAVLDTGVKSNIARSLTARGCRVSVLPYLQEFAPINSLSPDGVVLANGPGDPESASQVVATARKLIGRYPMMGICLGHQILGLAVGASTSRLKFGHRGSNHPVKDLASGRVHITAQNHGFQVDAQSIPAASGFFVSHINLNDGSVEGLAHRELPIFSVQYHPEAAPGPQDNQHLFDRFLDLVDRR